MTERALRILLVEDDEHLRFGVHFNLEKEGYAVRSVGTAEEGLAALAEDGADLVLLDVMLPDRSGFAVLEEVRASGREGLPVMMITARSDESDAVCALDLGADDYVRKPFGVSELLARIRAVLRRRAAESRAAARLGRWSLDLDNFRARAGADEIRLTAVECDLLSALLARSGDVASRETLLRAVWGLDAPTPTRTLDNHMARLRKKLEADPQTPRHLLTVHGVGYKLAP